ncbi:MAG TPA: hypothetical protein VFR67_28455 [Pilimelia sp.]|nr:hypothetical protein [Pilimelia sp.]
MLERELAMAYGCPVLAVVHRLVAGGPVTGQRGGDVGEAVERDMFAVHQGAVADEHPPTGAEAPSVPLPGHGQHAQPPR